MQELGLRLKSYEPFWGNWVISSQIFSGNNSNVYILERQRYGKTIYSAMKVIEISKQTSDTELPRILDEIERMEMLADSGVVVSVFDDCIYKVYDENGIFTGYDILIRMEYLDCIANHIRDGEIFSEDEIIKIGCEILKALAFIHSRGIIHRDIKASNIYRNSLGKYKLGDFGVSKRATGDKLSTITGTMAYMAPEVARGEVYGKQVDIYSLGILMYQLLNDNFLPLTDVHSTFSEREHAIQSRLKSVNLPPPKRGSKKLTDIILRACTPDTNKRFQSAEEMLSALENTFGTKCKIPKFAVKVISSTLLLAIVIFGSIYLYPNLKMLFSKSFSNIKEPADGITIIEGHKYQVIKRKATWDDAKIFCESQGGHLATITSMKEEKEIIQLLEDSNVTISWLGANNLNSSAGFKWITGEIFNFAAWGIREPNSIGNNEHYLMIVNKKDEGWVWNDAPDNGYDFYNNEQQGFICEWEEEKK